MEHHRGTGTYPFFLGDTTPGWENFVQRWEFTYSGYRSAVTAGHLRFGQALFNSLAIVDRELAERITNTDADPFFVDGNIDVFMLRVHQMWISRNDAMTAVKQIVLPK